MNRLRDLDLGYGEQGNYGYYGASHCDKTHYIEEIDALKQKFADAIDEARSSYASDIADAQADSEAQNIENDSKIALDFD